ncbi:MAG: threonine synthase [Anaerolineales bacterium]|nr:threonine synthase [Anaerolineales bacterium]
MSAWPGVIEHYRSLIDLPQGAPTISLLEGNSPLISMPRMAVSLGAAGVFVKFEGLNPTGSFKDRGMTVAISEAVHRGASSVICASTGNTAASAAAYAARAGLSCFVVIPEGKVAAGKLAGALAYGAQTIQVEGSFDDALSLVTEISQSRPIALVNSLNPFRLEGQKTAAFEICDTLGRAPDWIALPVGNAGNITSYWMGFNQYHDLKGTGLPHILGVQAAGSAPLVVGHAIEQPETIATAIRIGRPARGEQAMQAAQESEGMIIAVMDEAILNAQRSLAQEGIWVEPASAAGIAGLISRVESGDLDLNGQTVVCICTGHGLKDPDIIVNKFFQTHKIQPNLTALEEVIDSQ